MLPHVILHNAVSADGRIDNFTADIGLFYELAMNFKEDATLAGSGTILKPMEEIPDEEDSVFEPPEIDPFDKRPYLIIPDSKGQVRTWHYLRKQPYWRDWIALVSKTTTNEYLEYLKNRHINYICVGEDQVDLKTALEELNEKFGIKRVRVDSGGILNGVLLREGLVNEVSILIHPALVGGTSQRSIFQASDVTSVKDVISLKLSHVEKLKDDITWLKYNVIK